jgi:capsular polysaccharide biosynthesis protein
LIHRFIARQPPDSFWRRSLPGLVDLWRQWPWIYPRGIERSAQEWIGRSQRRLGWYAGLRSNWHESVYPGGVTVHPHPAGLSAMARASFNQVASRRFPAASVSFFSGAHVFGNEGLVLTPDNRVLAEYYHQFGVNRLSRAILSRPFWLACRTVQRIDGTLGLLAAPQGWNYYHWLHDVLPRQHLLERWSGVIEKYAVPANLSAVQRETLELLGVGPERLLLLAGNQRLRCQHLYVPSLPGSEGCSPPWVLPFLRDKFLPPAASVAGRGSLIYIVRGANAPRPVLNEEALIARLQSRGFTPVSPDRLGFLEQVALFRDAKLIVAAHGAGLANLAFANHTGVLELFSADYPRADCYFTLCCQAGHPYDCWLDPAKAGSARPWGGIVVDLDAVENKVDRLHRQLMGEHENAPP